MNKKNKLKKVISFYLYLITFFIFLLFLSLTSIEKKDFYSLSNNINFYTFYFKI